MTVWLRVGIWNEMYRLFPVSDKLTVPSVHCSLAPISRENYENTWLNLCITQCYPLVTRWLRVVIRHTNVLTCFHYSISLLPITISEKHFAMV